ncbi:uncharacterized protein (DUF1015 family) [Alkalibaculum bacchi]|uniref:Uncharacterized protein (DUF1015 family) n=1 Tax=Alkalibaculum bacchi TaxID=645887 RepID=A0A366IHM2_9FIRM|nr:DUF1015 family protein [Alkalibaculum bacchi]RBP70159.1 uncharacterized protein (DUF1015 family) [Alkalibaculum bacchi]
MAIIKDFMGIRPSADYVKKVAALPYDVYSSSEARKIVEGNPYSFLRVDRPETDFPESVNMYSEEVYQKAKDNLDDMIQENILVEDSQKSLYIYRLTMSGRKQTGLVCCCDIDDYLNGDIKKHELTREEKELDRINHVDYCNAHTGPIFMIYKKQGMINEIISSWIETNPVEYEFVSDDEIKHEIWVIDNTPTINTLKNIFSEIPALYIADGHHRAASAVKVGLKRRKENPDYTGQEEFNFFLSVLFPHDQIHIMDYNRVVKDLNGLSSSEFLEKISEDFYVELRNAPIKPSQKGTIGMYLEEKWYELKIKENKCSTDIVKNLDVSLLQDFILQPVLGIKDVRTDNRIDFVGGIRGLEELEKRCKEDMTIAFSMYPTSAEELMNISDEQKLMPPKSTWFEPKLRSGLFVHKLD